MIVTSPLKHGTAMVYLRLWSLPGTEHEVPWLFSQFLWPTVILAAADHVLTRFKGHRYVNPVTNKRARPIGQVDHFESSLKSSSSGHANTLNEHGKYNE